MKKTAENQFYFKQSLYMFRMTEGTSILSHLDKFNSIIIYLENIDSKINDENQTLLILYSLPNTMIYGKKIILSREIKSVLKSK